MKKIGRKAMLCLLVTVVFVMPISAVKNDVANVENSGVKTNIFTTTLNEEWNKTFGKSGLDVGVSVKQIMDGGYVITGFTESYGAGSRDVWLVRTDNDGNEQWNKTFGKERCDTGWTVYPTSDGGYIIGAQGRWPPDMDDTDGWLIKVDADGNEQWNKRFGGASGEEVFLGVQQISDGYIATGGTQSYGAGNWDVWLIKTDMNGDELWSKTFGGASPDIGYSVQQTSDGGYIIICQTVSYGAGVSDFWLIKTDSNGNIEWDKTFGGTDGDRGKSVQQTSDGGYIVAGITDSFGDGKGDALLIKTDANGNEQWSNTFEGSHSYSLKMWDLWGGHSLVQQTMDGGYVITGIKKGSEGFSDYDAWLAKVDEDGNKLWSKTFGGSSVDEAWSVQQTTDGGYIIAGVTKSYGSGDYDLWLIKVASFTNQRPDKPDKPSGSESGKTGEEYTYTTSTSDADGDQVYYMWDWGDGNFSDWLGPYNAGETCEAAYIWGHDGSYSIRVMAKDENGGESDWSDPLPVSMPKTYENPLWTLIERLFDWLEEIFTREILSGIFNF